MATLIIASTSPKAGKTAVAAGLAAHFGRDGLSTALSASSNEDAQALARIVSNAEVIKAPTWDADGLRRAAAVISKSAGHVDAVVVEGSTGQTEVDLRLSEEMDGLVVLVAGYGDNVVEAAKPYGDRLAGVIINNVPQYRRHHVETLLASDLSEAGIKLIGWLPESRRLLAPTIQLVAEHLDGSMAVCPENAGRLIDNFLIGGLILDWGPHYFSSQENVGVIVRGDRPDVQLAALQTDSVRALVLTKGIPPIEYVYYEASQRGIPVIVTSGDTHETAARIDTLLPLIRFDHPDKVERMADLIHERLDVDFIMAAVSQPATR